MSSHPVPQKTREFHNHHFDSTIWNDFEFRGDDSIIATYAKAGTTWLQQIAAPDQPDCTREINRQFWQLMQFSG